MSIINRKSKSIKKSKKIKSNEIPIAKSRFDQLKTIGKVVLGLGLVVYFGAYQYYIFRHGHHLTGLNEGLPANPKGLTTSQILFKYVEALNRTSRLHSETSTLLAEEPLADLIKTKLRPIQDRVTSLKVQTKMYEKMDKIPGGPKSFMNSALTELDTILNVNMVNLAAEVVTIMAKFNMRLIGLQYSSDELTKVTGTLLWLENKISKTLVDEQVLLSPTPDEYYQLFNKPKNPKPSQDELTLPVISEKLTALGKLHEERERALETVTKKVFSSRFGELMPVPEAEFRESLIQIKLNLLNTVFDEDTEGSDSEITELVWRLTDLEYLIEEVTDKNRRYFEQTMPILTQYSKELVDMTSRASAQTILDTEKRRPYFELSGTISSDIRKLQTRIRNMQYRYLKIQDDSSF